MGRRIAVARDRRFDDIRLLVEEQGSKAVSRTIRRSAPLDDSHTTEALLKLCDVGCDWLILVAGMGARVMVDAAETHGRKEDLLARMQAAKIAARGYKTIKVLRELGLKPVMQDDDSTTEGLRRELNRLTLIALESPSSCTASRCPS